MVCMILVAVNSQSSQSSITTKCTVRPPRLPIPVRPPSAAYTYENDLLKSITTGSTTYNFGYGSFGLRSTIKVGSATLASYTYTNRNNYLDTLAYGNGDHVKYTYDHLRRVTKETYDDLNNLTRMSKQ